MEKDSTERAWIAARVVKHSEPETIRVRHMPVDVKPKTPGYQVVKIHVVQKPVEQPQVVKVRVRHLKTDEQPKTDE